MASLLVSLHTAGLRDRPEPPALGAKPRFPERAPLHVPGVRWILGDQPEARPPRSVSEVTRQTAARGPGHEAACRKAFGIS